MPGERESIIQNGRDRGERAAAQEGEGGIRLSAGSFFLVLIAAAAGGFLIWQRYGSSNEKADLTSYYGLEEENDLAVVINGEVVRREENTGESEQDAAPAPGKMYDGAVLY